MNRRDYRLMVTLHGVTFCWFLGGSNTTWIPDSNNRYFLRGDRFLLRMK